ncbi:uncharacterized protein LOC124119157 [Haliotis rufescens]|uniref:uncharacterized protein LOC124119157 n=1 Tax=Haliotis rufescens TaxID=6454 RepID=UPI00201F76EA|nr:uncharacterized protein LOC124119157 [Haliotis rufescens]
MLWTLLFVSIIVEVHSIDVGDCICYQPSRSPICARVIAKAEAYFTIKLPTGNTIVGASLASLGDASACPLQCPSDVVVRDSPTCTANIVSTYTQTKVKAQFGGTCIYGLDHTISFRDAKDYCVNNGLKLVQLQDPDKQKKVFEATNWMQHWMHLEKTSGTWRWGGAVGEAMTNPRWEQIQDATNFDRAFTMTTLNQNKFLWKGGDNSSSYRPVCEGAATECVSGSQGCAATFTESVKSGIVDGRCFYGVSAGKKYPEARSSCENNGLKLAWVQTQATQDSVNQATGLKQYWIGLEKIGGTWTWVAPDASNNVDASSDVGGRWQGNNDASNAYVKDANLKKTNGNPTRDFVCEGATSFVVTSTGTGSPSAGSCLCVNNASATAFSTSGGAEVVSVSTCFTATGSVRTGDLFGSLATLSFYEVNRPGLNTVWVLSTHLDARANTSCTNGGGPTTTIKAQGCRVYFSESVVEAVVDDRCIYGVNSNVKRAAARALCEDKGLRLAWVETQATQDKISAATGFSQYWVGLEQISGAWTWLSIDGDSNTDASSDVVGRWNGNNDDQYAYVQGSKLKKSNPNPSKKVVCQEVGRTIDGPTIGTCMCVTAALSPAFSFWGIPVTVLKGECFPSAGSGRTGDFFGQTASLEFYELVRPGSGSVWVLSSNLSQVSSQRCNTNLLCTDETIVRNSDECSTSFAGYDYMKSNTQFGSTCVYGLNHVLSYSQAKAYCEVNGLKLVQLQDPQKQKKVFEATGYSQHWMHLEKTSGTWRWGGAGGEAMTNARWEQSQDADNYDRAFTMTTLNQNKFLWKGGDESLSYRPVCEGRASGCSPRGTCMCVNSQTALALVLPAALKVLSKSDCYIATGDVTNGTTFGRDLSTMFFELTNANGSSVWVLSSDVDQSPYSNCGRFEKGDCLCTTGVATGVAVYGSQVTVSSYIGGTCYRATGDEVAGDDYGFPDVQFVALQADTNRILLMEKSVLAKESDVSKCPCVDQTVYKGSASCTQVFQQSLPSAMSLTAKIGGRCLYGVDSTMNYVEAKTFCEVNSLRLVRVEDDTFASKLEDGIGFQTYWVGLEKIGGTWTWVAPSSSANKNAEADVAGRWQRPNMAANFDRATVHASGGTKFRLKGTNANSNRRVICEEIVPCSGVRSVAQFLVALLCALISHLVSKM